MIKIENLKFQYSESNSFAIDDVSLEIQTGKYVAILGHNGSGKSTLSKLLVGLYKPSAGKIIIDDIELKKNTLRKIREKIGIIFQNPENQFIGATVEDDIAFGLENKKLKRDRMKYLLHKYAKEVDMLKFLSHEPQNLSGGQKQRVAMAAILALDPEIIIFDEVTSMLDPKGKSRVLEIIKSLQENRKKTLISITHDMDEAIQADELLVFSQGKLVAKGDPKTILANKEIIELAKIDSPFIYRVSEQLKHLNVEPTYDKANLLEQVCK